MLESHDPSLSETVSVPFSMPDYDPSVPTRGAGKDAGQGTPGSRLKSNYRRFMKSCGQGMSLKQFAKTDGGEDGNQWLKTKNCSLKK